VPESKTWRQELAKALRTMWLFKMLSTMGAIAVFFYAYFWVMRHPLSTVTTMPEIGIDELISFQPQSFFLYVSLWVYVTFGTALARDLRELAAYGAASLVMAVIGLGIFMLAPSEAPHFAFDWHRYPSLAFLKTVDVSRNACPSLHAAFSVFTGFVLHRHLAAARAPRGLAIANVLWGLGILYSAIATRQHVALDVIAGSALGILGAFVYLAAIRLPGRAGRREREPIAT